MIEQYTLDLSQLDPETAYLYLMIQTTQELDVPVRQVTAQIACSIQSLARMLCRERIGHELLGCQVRSVQITARQTGSSNVELARHADRNRRHRAVQDIDPPALERTTDTCRRRAQIRVTYLL